MGDLLLTGNVTVLAAVLRGPEVLDGSFCLHLLQPPLPPQRRRDPRTSSLFPVHLVVRVPLTSEYQVNQLLYLNEKVAVKVVKIM